MSAKWERTWEELRQASGLPIEEFPAFVRDCDLCLGYDPLADTGTPDTRDHQQLLRDIDHIRHAVFDLAATPETSIELNRSQLIDRLGWHGRFEPRHRHAFPIDEVLYQPIRASAAELEARLAGVATGYIGVFGTPGSGKSSLLTHSLRYRRERVIRYYAYVPGSQDPSLGRGEAVNFLHDLVVALEREGIKAGEGLIPFDREHLAERLHKQLQLLHEDWALTRTKTLILVDGLDHVDRELRPERSFLNVLPAPDQVPEGVVFVLGSQTDDPLPDRVQHAVRLPERRVQMRPLAREEIFRVTDAASLRLTLSEDQKDRIAALSAGHPLALSYLLNRLEEVKAMDDVDALLDDTLRYQGDIAAYYHAHWRQVEHETGVARALAYIARIRGPIDPDWFEEWLGDEAIQPIRRRFAHFFRREGPRWYIFHNSFRLYLLDRTAESWPGEIDPRRDAKLHATLSDKCAAEPPDSRWAWEEIYHRSSAGQHERVLLLATQDYFRRQFLALRPPAAIEADIALSLGSAALLQDSVAFCRLILAGAELGQRAYHLDRVPLIGLLLAIADPQIVVDYLRGGQRLRIPDREALEACSLLMTADMAEEAARVFDLAEPLNILGASKPIEDDFQGETRKLLEAWAEVAPAFRRLEDVLEVARRLHMTFPDRHGFDEGQATRDLRNTVAFHAGLGLIALKRWDELATVVEAIDESADGINWRFWLMTRAWRACASNGADDQARAFVEEVRAWARPDGLGDEARIMLAEAAYRVLGDEDLARHWLQGVPQPEVSAAGVSLDAAFRPFIPGLRFQRLSYALGDSRDPVQVVPDSPNEEHRGLRQFERLVCVAASIQATAWRASPMAPSAIVAAVEPYLFLFDRRLDRPDRRVMGVSWYIARQARAELAELLVDAASAHGPQAVDELRAAFERSWRSTPWTEDDRRAAVLALARSGAPRPWLEAQLRELETTMLRGQLTFERVQQGQRQAEAWLAAGFEDEALRMLEVILREANAVSFRKDNQLATWITQWLSQMNAVNPDGAEARITWFARAILDLAATTEDGAERYAAEAHLRAAFCWSPRRAVSLLRWCLEERLLSLDDAISAILLAAVKTEDPPLSLVAAILVDVYLPIASSGPSPGLLRRLVAAVVEAEGQNAAVEQVRLIMGQVATFALQSAREDWRRFLREALERSGVDATLAGLGRSAGGNAAIPATPSMPLRLANGSTLSAEDVLARATSVEAVRDLLGLEAADSHYFWLPTIERIAAAARPADLLILAESFADRQNALPILSFLRDKLTAIGDRERAREVALKALDAIEPWKWDRSWGEGTKIDAARQLVEIDRLWAVPRILDRLVADTATQRGFGTIAQNLDELLPLLAKEVPVAQIWTEVEDFVRALFAAHDLPDPDLGFLKNPPARDTVEQALGDLVLMHLRHPALALAQAAQRICAEGVLCGAPVMIRVVRDGLRGSEELQEAVVELLDAVALRDRRALEPLRDDVLALTTSPNFAIRSTAVAICDRAGWPHEGIRRPKRRSVAYDLALPLGPPLELKPASARAVAASSGDPRLLLRPFESTLRRVALVAGLSEEAVLQRAARLMRELAIPDSWSWEAEKRLAADLRSASLYIPFRALRPVVGRRALFHVVAELVDSGDIDDQGLARLAPWLRVHDPAMVLKEPSPRPETVTPMVEPASYGRWDETWLGRVDESCGILATRPKGEAVVLAERTQLQRLTFDEPAEERRVVVRLGSSSRATLDPDVEEIGIELVLGAPLSAYLELDTEIAPLSVVVGNAEGNAYDTPGWDWLALNPAVGIELGWKLDESGLFRWVDSEGKLAIESVWWIDGVPGVHWSSPGQGEVGEGWIILASDEAIDAIRNRYGPLSRRIRVTRRIRGEADPPLRELSCYQDTES